MKGRRALYGLLKALGVFVGLSLVFLILLPCPPWSLKEIIARRTGCLSNLRIIDHQVQERGIPFDREHVTDIEGVIAELGVTCSEGSKVKGRPAGYQVEVRADGIVITEEPGNHPAHKRFMAGEVPAERLEVDASGEVRRRGGP